MHKKSDIPSIDQEIQATLAMAGKLGYEIKNGGGGMCPCHPDCSSSCISCCSWSVYEWNGVFSDYNSGAFLEKDLISKDSLTVNSLHPELVTVDTGKDLVSIVKYNK